MHLLLDTHTFLWVVWNDPQISAGAMAAIQDPENEIFLNIVSVWETAVEIDTGRL